MKRHPPRVSIALSAFGGAAIISAILFLGASFYLQDEIARAFCLGAFFSGLLGAVMLFGFSKVIDVLDAIRAQTRSSEEEAEGHDAGGGTPVSGESGSSRVR